MNKKISTILVSLIIIALSACASLPPPKPLEPESAAIGISLKLQGPIKLFKNEAARVFFVKVDRKDNPYNKTQLISSNYVKGNQVYLLNAKPGQYAAVAAFYDKDSPLFPPSSPSGGVSVSVTYSRKTQYTTYFSKEIIENTLVEAKPGTMTFMGDYVVDMSLRFKDADDAQLHYYRLIAPNEENKNAFLSLISGDHHYRGSPHEMNHDKQAEIRFLTHAIETFGGSGWINIVQKRIKALKAEK